MMLKIKKRDFIFLLASLLIAIPLIIGGLLIVTPTVFGAVNRSFFIVELTITGRAPVIFNVNWTSSTASGNLVDGSKASFTFTFNVSDEDGFGDIDHNKAAINITLSNGQSNRQVAANTTNCSITTYNINYSYYSCTVLLDYYYNASSNWVVNVSIEDSGGTKAVNDTLRFTVNSLTAMSLVNAVVNFSGASVTAGANDVAATTNPFIVNNTGNFDFTKINITGQNLTGLTDGAVITPGNITVNGTNNAVGAAMLKGVPVTIPTATLTHGEPGVGNRSLWFYVDVPTGLSAQVFNVSDRWEITLE